MTEPLRRACVIGHPVSQSRSPLVHGYWLKKYDIAGDYIRKDVAPDEIGAFIEGLRSGEAGFVGCNVTIPHKVAAFELADRPDALATALGAANTLWVRDGLVHASNTDAMGFSGNLDAEAPGWDKVEKAVILGAGGGARSIVEALVNRGIAEIHLINRTLARAEELAERFGPEVKAAGMDALSGAMEGAGLFVNSTSLGMKGGAVPEFDFSILARGALVTDIVYVPLETPILKQAREQGFATVDGLGMLLHQAVPGFEKWFGQRPEVDSALRAEILADLEVGA
ncbi:shikimate dehydrogenase [Martelella endophytica]|uniref:Shikimate dehydrogenase (NADP(+)) n=1 Tax=Martelella endophytica TaxID=1486262 RepID=A0A0D5LPD6_MAREN|nr:shikimate dehydrogenase [Martelella endophytica]AJY45188.1 shikimate dehydrogenase [Martelella endophytica]